MLINQRSFSLTYKEEPIPPTRCTRRFSPAQVETNVQQVDVNKCLFPPIPAPTTVNHVVVFLTGIQPFPEGLGMTTCDMVDRGVKLLHVTTFFPQVVQCICPGMGSGSISGSYRMRNRLRYSKCRQQDQKYVDCDSV